jgi:hypothetical protein
MTVPSFSQAWGPMQDIWWDNYPPTFLGYFNPSYCQPESLLYFDTYYRFFPDEGGIIYVSKLDSLLYDQLIWSDPEPLPEPINLPGYRNAMPSISHSGDTLFFCSDRPGTRGGLDIWMSVKTDTFWGEPVNLGDSVNGPFDEFAPNYAPSISTLFFDSPDSAYYYSKIYTCQYYGDNIWGTPVILPENVNIPMNYNYGAFYDDGGQNLYYTSADFQYYMDSIAKSHYANGGWGDPEVLSENVNGFWYPNICNIVTTEDASISADGSLLFYGKQIWDGFCIDFFSYLFYSELSTSIIEERPVNISIYDIKIHPNPSNSQFLIYVENDNQPYILKIYNVRGRLVKIYKASRDRVNVWGGTDYDGLTVSSGIYFAVASIDGYKLVKKMVLIK